MLYIKIYRKKNKSTEKELNFTLLGCKTLLGKTRGPLATPHLRNSSYQQSYDYTIMLIKREKNHYLLTF